MAQIVVRLDAALTADLDALVADGVAASRSDAVRQALERFIDQRRRAEIGRQIVAGYTAIPQEDDDDLWPDRTIEMIEEEPW